MTPAVKTVSHVMQISSVISDVGNGAIVSGFVIDADDNLFERRIKARMGYDGPAPKKGDVWRLVGQWRTGKYGPQFEASSATRSPASGKLIVKWLAGRVDGIGETRARRLVDAFGNELEKLLGGCPDEAMRTLGPILAPTFPALGARLASSLVSHWNIAAHEANLVAWLESHGVSSWRVARLVLDVLGDSPADKLEANPYILCALLPWPDVDRIGKRVLANSGINDPARATCRLVGAVDTVVRWEINKGHTAVDNKTLELGLRKLLHLPDLVAEAIRLGVVNGAIIPFSGGWRAPGCAGMEDGLLAKWLDMLTHPKRGIVQPTAEKIDIELRKLERKGALLHAEQRAAILKLLQQPVAVLTGGAGTGKTTTTRYICDVWEALGGSVLLCALSGKATLRLSQGAGRLAKTIHRTLAELGTRESLSDVDAPVPGNLALINSATLVIVDEASMVDLGQWSQLCRRLAPGAHLLMVGDVGQLPPIGFGLVFHRLCSEKLVTAQLTVVHRQTEASGIPAISASIRKGRIANFAHYDGLADGVSWISCSTAAMGDEIQAVAEALGGFRDSNALQIITATHSGEAGVDALNDRFHQRYTRQTHRQAIKGSLGQWFSPGEPLVHLRNDYSRGLFNGSMGRVVSVDPSTRTLIALFDGIDYYFGSDKLIDLSLAYAITCHRAQGSQATRVIVPIYDSALLDPAWIYTAITRGERQVVLIGSQRVLQCALERTPAWQARRTGWPNFEISPAPSNRWSDYVISLGDSEYLALFDT